MKELIGYQQRVVQEQDDLDDKILKLENFKKTPVFEQLSAAERDLLSQQLIAMWEYSRLLAERIYLWRTA